MYCNIIGVNFSEIDVENNSCPDNILYTQQKPLCSLRKIQNTFLIEFRVIPTAKVFKLVCYTLHYNEFIHENRYPFTILQRKTIIYYIFF
jgi:hypothetical protein